MSKKSNKKKLDADLDVELDEYEPSDSEDNYSEDEKLLLDTVRKGSKEFDDESEEEVLGIVSDDDDDDDDDDDGDEADDAEDGSDMASDLDGAGAEERLPNPKAWGHKKKDFYSSDYVDADYGGGFQKEEEEEAALLEEEEAREIQRRLASELRDEDFGLSAFVTEDKTGDEQTEEVVASDLNKLSRRQKLTLLQKESPEFFGLTRDFSEKMGVLRDELEPVMALVRAGKIPACDAAQFVITVYHLILNYCTNITFYLLLKARRIPIATHPVVARLAKYRKLLLQAESMYHEVVKPQLAEVLTADWDHVAGDAPAPEKTEESKKKKKKQLKLLSMPAVNGSSGESDRDREEELAVKKKKRRKDEEQDEELESRLIKMADKSASGGSSVKLAHLAPSNSSSSAGEESAAGNSEEPVGSKADRRAITYEMAKNKGLTPYRKKELRNPRVRHRRKYEKARVRRKGQVREPRKEVKKYGGEISGIKIGVSKSVKLKV